MSRDMADLLTRLSLPALGALAWLLARATPHPRAAFDHRLWAVVMMPLAVGAVGAWVACGAWRKP